MHSSSDHGETPPPPEERVLVRKDGPVTIVSINRPAVRNAVDRRTAEALADAFRAFDADPDAAVAILTGEGGTFCAGADLKAVAAGDPNRFAPDGDAPMGVSRLRLSKPVIAAISGHAVAGGLELALWADLRVADDDAVLGVFCRRWGVPLIDGGTVRLPRLIGMGHAMDLILTGRAVPAEEARAMGLVNRLAPSGTALEHALALAHELTRFPQTCLREDRLSTLEQEGLTETDAMANEHQHGRTSLLSDTLAGATRFADGAGRHGSFTDLGTTTDEDTP
ncbi:enoyl-CoA hydratase [Tsukamurella pulmonis]|uniref:crotonase/enoyl-CoA hydratase family protein n=1 Tax=Tsukamurella pulmonis TaxID=47312 RepID=UPI000793E2E5|nr:crotonase/enoyl-CoA hydratase family protein [Tsukamurella pulmonis]KXO94240.1 enoyl-CoA hydratase [Tsukamurella pulmonis]KXP08369.1 enoyl-CoA hydratase [Tsukamurella pulmonis]RDH11040.1 crotonase/enoyl-CoA hydratase family protein [Tsukamurella pulmonis]